ncbi:MAG: hypothetical protein PHT40_04090 [Patescibacteria group bacterium]|nr:hypothetical protein [Patescibacteria group bacterium]
MDDLVHSWGIQCHEGIKHLDGNTCKECGTDILKFDWVEHVVGFTASQKYIKSKNHVGAVVIKCHKCDFLSWRHITKDQFETIENNRSLSQREGK